MLVMKFGGTSVGGAERMTAVANIIGQVLEGHPQLAVVVSAMSGVTDQLIGAARAAAGGRWEECKGIQASLAARHMEVCQDLLTGAHHQQTVCTSISARVAELERFCQSIAVMGEVTRRGLDAVSSIGEKLSATILSALLCAQGSPAVYVDASQVLVTDDRFGAANPLLAETAVRLEERVRPLVERGVVPIITGFIGATVEGVPTTVGRGGGDY
jgi:aspartate kinase